MKLGFTILELDRNQNSDVLRKKLTFIRELKTVVCDGRKEFPLCCQKYPEFQHIFDSLTNTGLIGLWISTLNAFYEFIASEFDSLLILEDDVILVQDFENKFQKCLIDLPDDWGMFSIGYRNLYLDHHSKNHSVGKKNVSKIFQTGDSWGILYRKEFVEDLLNAITSHKILGGFSDTAIISYGLGHVGYESKYKAYSTSPSMGSLLMHEDSPDLSSINNSPIKNL